MGEFGECGRMGGWKLAWRVKGWEGGWIVRGWVLGVGWDGVQWSDLRWGGNYWGGCRLQAEGGCRGCLTVQVRILLPFFALHPLNSSPCPLSPLPPPAPPSPPQSSRLQRWLFKTRPSVLDTCIWGACASHGHDPAYLDLFAWSLSCLEAQNPEGSPSPSNSRDEHGWTPLHACCTGETWVDGAELLLSAPYGTDVNARWGAGAEAPSGVGAGARAASHIWWHSLLIPPCLEQRCRCVAKMSLIPPPLVRSTR